MNTRVISVMEVMQSSTANRAESIRLERGKLARIEAKRRARIVCTEGTLWLTKDEVPEDYVLEAGQSLELDRGALVTALRTGAYHLA